MRSPTNGLRLNDQRLIIASVANLRSTRQPARTVTVAANDKALLAENNTPFPLSVNLQATNNVPASFAPQSDPFLGSTAMIRTIQTSGTTTVFILPPYTELWVQVAALEVFRVTETRL